MKLGAGELAALQQELQALAGDHQVKLHVRHEAQQAVAVSQTDESFIITIRRQNIRSRQQWEAHKNWLRKLLGEG